MKMFLGFLDITHATGKVPFGWTLISKWQNSPIVHVFVVFQLGEEHTVYETSETVYLKRPLRERMAGCKAHFFEVFGDTEAAHDYCEGLVSSAVPYDYPSYIGFSILLGAEWLINKLIITPVNWCYSKLAKIMCWANNKPYPKLRLMFVANPFHSQKALFCSEAAINAVNKANTTLPSWWQSAAVLPRQFYWFVLERDKEFPLTELPV